MDRMTDVQMDRMIPISHPPPPPIYTRGRWGGGYKNTVHLLWGILQSFTNFSMCLMYDNIVNNEKRTLLMKKGQLTKQKQNTPMSMTVSVTV